MPENGFVMRFFGCARRSVGVVGAERSIHLSYGRKYECPFGRIRGGDVFSPAFAGERSTLLRRARTFCEGPPELRTQM